MRGKNRQVFKCHWKNKIFNVIKGCTYFMKMSRIIILEILCCLIPFYQVWRKESHARNSQGKMQVHSSLWRRNSLTFSPQSLSLVCQKWIDASSSFVLCRLCLSPYLISCSLHFLQISWVLRRENECWTLKGKGVLPGDICFIPGDSIFILW